MVQSGYLNVRDLLGHDVLLLAKEAVGQVDAWLGVDKAQAGASLAPAAGVATEE
jgi:hypothetical protein